MASPHFNRLVVYKCPYLLIVRVGTYRNNIPGMVAGV